MPDHKDGAAAEPDRAAAQSDPETAAGAAAEPGAVELGAVEPGAVEPGAVGPDAAEQAAAEMAAAALVAAEAVTAEGEAAKNSWDALLVGLMLAAMVVLNFVGVVSRYWLKASLPWIPEVLIGLFGWLVFIGCGLTVVRGMHVGFALFTGRLRPPLPWLLAQLRLAAFAIFFAVLAWYGTEALVTEARSGSTTVVLGIPTWLFSAAVPAGSAVALVRIGVLLVADVNRQVRAWRS